MMNLIILTTLFICISTSSAKLKADDNLISVIQVFRHGERTPYSFYPNDPYQDRSNWPEDKGQLVNEGKRQLYDLGKYTRTRYRGFIPQEYSKDDFYIQTTDVDRTHMSAQTYLAGLFPPDENQEWHANLTWQPIPVHPVDPKIFSSEPSCPGFLAEITEVTMLDDLYVQLNRNYSHVYSTISSNAGLYVFNILEAMDIYDTLFIEDLFGYELPDWTDTIYPQPLKLLAGYGFLSFSYTDKQKRLTTGLWLNTVINHFETLLKNPSSVQKYRVFSGHDTNIAGILNTFGAFVPHTPYFASTIFLELRNSSSGTIINVWHRNGTNEIHPVTIKGCDFNCTFENFKNVLKTWTVTEADWNIECNSIIDNIFSAALKLIRYRLQQIFNKRWWMHN